MSEIIRLSRLATIDRIILNSDAGTNTFKIVSFIFEPEKPSGFWQTFPSIAIDVIVDETRRISSSIQNSFFPFIFARANDSPSIFLIIESISDISIGISRSER